MVTGKEDAANIYARGHYTIGKEGLTIFFNNYPGARKEASFTRYVVLFIPLKYRRGKC